MIRIGIYGSENSHAMAFSRIFNGGEPRYADLRVTAIGGEEIESSEKIRRECGVEFLAKAPEDMLGLVDAVMITSRDGALHARYALPFVEKGMPVFVDKPFTRSIAEAEALCALAKERGARLMGGSSVKLTEDVSYLAAFARDPENGRPIGGSCWAPVSMHNAYGDFWFYAAHLAEMCLHIWGAPAAVQAFRNGDDITAVARYAEYDVSMHYTEGAYNYGAAVLMGKRAATRPVNLADCYAREAEQFALMARGGAMPESFEELILPVRFLDALARSLESGACERL